MRRRGVAFAAAVVLAAVVAAPASAQTTYYTGTTAGQWLTDSIWSTNPAGPFTGLWDNSGSSAAFISGTGRTLTITSGTALVSTALTGTVPGTVTINGGGRLAITGTAPSISHLGGSGAIALGVTVITDPGSTLTLSQRVVLNSGITFSATPQRRSCSAISSPPAPRRFDS